MSRRYDDQVDVVRRDDEPAQFFWRERLYVVRDVLARWVEAGAWWQTAQAQSLSTGEPTGESVIDSAPGVVLDDREREMWRVVAGRRGSTGVFDLGFDWSTGTWVLVRALD
jgi:uncharacterized protein DUF6504